MNVFRLTPNDTAAINYISTKLIDATDKKPNAVHLKALLSDDRTYLFSVKMNK